MLVWKHSHHYNSPGRIVVLVREICNDLIMQSQKFVVGEEIFAVEPPEARGAIPSRIILVQSTVSGQPECRCDH